MRHVLLLGSDKFLTDLIQYVFGISDFEVYKCTDIATAADLIKKKKFDYFITDQKPEAFSGVNIKNLLPMTCHTVQSADINFYCKLL